MPVTPPSIKWLDSKNPLMPIPTEAAPKAMNVVFLNPSKKVGFCSWAILFIIILMDGFVEENLGLYEDNLKFRHFTNNPGLKARVIGYCILKVYVISKFYI